MPIGGFVRSLGTSTVAFQAAPYGGELYVRLSEGHPRIEGLALGPGALDVD